MNGIAKVIAPLLVIALGACRQAAEAPPVPAARPVSVVAVEAGKVSRDLTLSGEIAAEKTIALAFRIGGRVVERPVAVGDMVQPGQLVARLDPALERNAVTAARAALEAARGEVATARTAFERQERLMVQGFTTRPNFDRARNAYEAAQAALETAEADLDRARDRLGFTTLQADVAGTVTARRVEPGEVVQPGQTIVEIAREDGRDAVFDMPASWLEAEAADRLIRVALADAPEVTANGRIREVAPQADPVTRTFRVKVALTDPPPAMRLGATVVGTLETRSAAIIAVPASALTQTGDAPAVWIVDGATSTVSLRPVEILRFEPGRVVVSQGLEPGETVVTGGIQALHPGQRVVPLPARADDKA